MYNLLTMSKRRIQLSLHPDLVIVAQDMQKCLKYGTFSEYVEALIRDAWRRSLTSRETTNSRPSSTDQPEKNHLRML